eukprot:CAMPEP_0114427420 /NCGR_PEP_ID=MMETSP0103-20121206/8339_1 /TAXON_ID=37642 ORGANISM="Paraphysomonas imperforata, Strain PA2" /NCGR_SAMPLE_ID=MMETSP0103 /ASSEMBLY_ACC=CAM_ASM_000201 /LENGTH=505 /DNA_ID=CAMNT_0001596481 /DNA_START=125 /DNA_END=1642 /DNA_ORIENTATION=+
MGSSSVRKKAREMLNKEKMNTTKSRLECLLVQQFQTKYGSRQPNTQLNNLIKNTVHKFVDAHDDVSTNPNLVQALENQIKDQTEKYKADVVKRNEQSARAQESLQLSSKQKNSSVQSMDNRHKLQTPPAEYAIDPHQWAVINAIQAASVEEAAEKERAAADKKKAIFRNQLDEQLSQVEQRKQIAFEEKRKIRLETEQMKRTVELEQERADKIKRQQFERDRDMIVHQMDDRRARKEHEREQSILQDKIDMRRAQARAKEEEDLKLMKKMKQKASQEQLRIQNEKDKESKMAELQKLRLLDLKKEEEYRIKLEKEDKARADAFQKRMDAMQSIGKRFETEGAGAKERKINEQNERRLQEEIREKNAIEELKERKKIEDRQSRTQSISAENYRIMQERALKKEHALRDSAAMKARFEKEYMESKEAEARKEEHRRLKAMELKRGLDVQIAEKRFSEGDSAKNALNSREIELNKSLLKKIEKDENFQKSIYNRLHPKKQEDTGFAFA